MKNMTKIVVAVLTTMIIISCIVVNDRTSEFKAGFDIDHGFGISVLYNHN